MLDFVLREAAQFRRTHGYDPNVVYLTEEHFHQLREALPLVFTDEPLVRLGFAIAILPKESLLYPRVAFMPRVEESNSRDLRETAAYCEWIEETAASDH